MADGKKSFVLYCDQRGIWDKLDNEQAGKLIKHIISYVNDENPIVPDFIIELAFEPIKAQLKRDLKKWEEQRATRSEAGRLGGLKTQANRKQNQAKPSKAKQSQANQAVNVNVNDNVNDNVYINTYGPKEEKHFITVIPQLLGATKYRINGATGLREFVEASGGRLPLYSDEQGRRFMRNNDGNRFNDYNHVYNSWQLFIKQTA